MKEGIQLVDWADKSCSTEDVKVAWMPKKKMCCFFFHRAPKRTGLKQALSNSFLYSFTCNVEGADWQPWKLSPLFLHRTGIARAAAMQASPHCPANVPQPTSEEVTSGGEWVEESPSMQFLLPGSGSCGTGCWMETDPLSWMSHQLLTDNHSMYCEVVGLGSVAFFCLTAVTFWYFFVVGWHLCFFSLLLFALFSDCQCYVYMSTK